MESKKLEGNLKCTADDKTDAMVLIADFTGRARALGWDVDEIVVTVVEGDDNGE